MSDEREVDESDIPSLDDFRLDFDEDGEPEPLEAETKFGTVYIKPVQYEAERAYGLWGKSLQDIFNMTAETHYEILSDHIVNPDFSNFTFEEFQQLPGDVVYELLASVCLFGGVFSQADEDDGDAGNPNNQNLNLGSMTNDGNLNTDSTQNTDTVTEDQTASTD